MMKRNLSFAKRAICLFVVVLLLAALCGGCGRKRLAKPIYFLAEGNFCGPCTVYVWDGEECRKVFSLDDEKTYVRAISDGVLYYTIQFASAAGEAGPVLCAADLKSGSITELAELSYTACSGIAVGQKGVYLSLIHGEGYVVDRELLRVWEGRVECVCDSPKLCSSPYDGFVNFVTGGGYVFWTEIDGLMRYDEHTEETVKLSSNGAFGFKTYENDTLYVFLPGRLAVLAFPVNGDKPYVAQEFGGFVSDGWGYSRRYPYEQQEDSAEREKNRRLRILTRKNLSTGEEEALGSIQPFAEFPEVPLGQLITFGEKGYVLAAAYYDNGEETKYFYVPYDGSGPVPIQMPGA